MVNSTEANGKWISSLSLYGDYSVAGRGGGMNLHFETDTKQRGVGEIHNRKKSLRRGATLQGDTSRCSQGWFDIKTNVAF